TREVAYNLMLQAQRRRLHRRVAAWLERAPASGERPADGSSRTLVTGPEPALLAHHLLLADEPGEALGWLERAGDEALRGGANREAAELFARALTRWPDEPRRRRARWERRLGEARFALGALPAAAGHMGRALALLDHPVPHS